MAHTNKVVHSINDADASRCVDVFVRPNGSFGFEEYRRDVEDGRGWFPVGGHGARSFPDASTAGGAAIAAVTWLAAALQSGGMTNSPP